MVFSDPTTWSFPGNVSTTLNNGYFNISMLPSAIITRFPTFISCKYDIHICLLVKPRRYFLIHFFQNMSFIACVAFDFALRFLSFSVVAMNLSFGDARATKKWFGFKDFVSLGSLVNGVDRRLFTILSISTKVWSIFSVTSQSFKTAMRHSLVIFTRDSIVSPICGLGGGLKYHLTLFSLRFFFQSVFFFTDTDDSQDCRRR